MDDKKWHSEAHQEPRMSIVDSIGIVDVVEARDEGVLLSENVPKRWGVSFKLFILTIAG